MDCSFGIVDYSRVKRDPIIGNNIYDNFSYRQLQNYLNKLICNNTVLARYPMQTGVIPTFYNQLQAVAKREAYHKHQYLENIKRKELELKEKEKQDKIVEWGIPCHCKFKGKDEDDIKNFKELHIEPMENLKPTTNSHSFISLIVGMIFLIILLSQQYV
jgi:hypothetical protein